MDHSISGVKICRLIKSNGLPLKNPLYIDTAIYLHSKAFILREGPTNTLKSWASESVSTAVNMLKCG